MSHATFFNCCAAVDKESKQATGWKWSYSLPANETYSTSVPSWRLCLLCEQCPWLIGLRHCGTVQARGSRVRCWLCSIRVYIDSVTYSLPTELEQDLAIPCHMP